MRCDFEDMIKKYTTDFDLKGEMDKGALPSDPVPRPKKRLKARRSLDTINTSKMRGKSGGFGESSEDSYFIFNYKFYCVDNILF